MNIERTPAPEISDNELILYFYRDGLDARRIDEIDDALFAVPALRRRYTALQQLLHEIDAAPALTPDPELTERVWRRLEAELGPAPRLRWRWPQWQRVRPAFAAAFALVLVLALGVAFFAGRWSAPQESLRSAAAAHVLDAYVAAHLRATDGLLLTASNSDSTELRNANRELAQSLLETNRMYALAAQRSGDTRLADLLRQLEPILIELANQSADAPVQSLDGLRDYLRRTDLRFELRATQARIEPAERHGI
jgi:hypothetical protein